MDCTGFAADAFLNFSQLRCFLRVAPCRFPEVLQFSKKDDQVFVQVDNQPELVPCRLPPKAPPIPDYKSWGSVERLNGSFKVVSFDQK